MEILIYGTINSVSLFLISVGFSFVYGISRIPNFAHGSLYCLTGFAVWFALNVLHLSYPVCIILGIGLTAIVGALIYRLVLIRVRGMPTSEIIASYAVGLAIMEALRCLGFKGKNAYLGEYENMIAVNGVNLRCKEKDIVGVFGANSAGKSSLMYAISGIILDIKKKEEMIGGERISLFGKVYFKGEDITYLPPSKRAELGIVLCPERRRIFSESSVMENLLIGGYLANKRQAKETLEYVFQIFPELWKIRKRAAGFLSGGEQQMLAIGRALMAQPKLLLLDEPLLGLSPKIQKRLIKTIVQIRDERDITILIAEQYARPVLPVVDYAYIIENGSIVLEGDSEDVMNNPDARSAYFGV